MLVPKPFLLPTALLLILGLLSPAAAAAEAAEASASSGAGPAAWEVKLRRVEGADVMPSTWAYITTGTNRFAINVPAGFRFDPGQSADKAVFVSDDLSKVLTFRVIEPLGAESQELDPAAYREAVLARYPGAKLIEESSQHIDARSGPGVDIQWSGAGGVNQRGRFAFFWSPAGVLELSITCRPEKIEEARSTLAVVLMLFRLSDSKGQLNVPVLSNKF